ncbi:MAG: methyl-accepting chemotaxis protein [Blautia sp.]|nr:methyl-accepting chemotaxis protein [Blautia sp.]
MKLGKSNQISALIASLSELTPSPALQAAPEAGALFSRMANNRAQFETAFGDLTDALMKISSLDLQLTDDVDKLTAIAQSVSDATTAIHNASKETSDVAVSVSGQHEELTNTIIAASEESGDVYKKIEAGQEELTQIKELSQSTIKASEEMKQDMDQLSEVINRMNEVIEGINSISSQTNLLSLNASIEAARAGEAGRGFAVVADEIRDLANETQKLTQNMGGFVEGVKEASKKSVASANHTITALESMTEKIGNVWQINEENQKQVADISNNISSLAAVSEEISSSMLELENQATEIRSACGILSHDTDDFHTLGTSLKESIQPVSEIESAMDATAKTMGQMSGDPTMHLGRACFTGYFERAITAHQAWIEKLGEIVKTRMIMPLQMDDSKCGFGHFYYSLTPQFPEIIDTWKALGPKHKKFHDYGSRIVKALFNEDYDQAEQLYEEAVNYSVELIHDLESMRDALK